MSDVEGSWSLRTSGDERAVLVAFLDAQREAVVRKVDGLSEADMRVAGVASGTSPGGIVKHLVDVERWWFQAVFAGRDVAFAWTDDDPDPDWRIEQDDTLPALIEAYRSARDESNRIVAGAGSLDDLSADSSSGDSGKRASLRWILVHMIEETARHAGHVDILREQLDGAVGL